MKTITFLQAKLDRLPNIISHISETQSKTNKYEYLSLIHIDVYKRQVIISVRVEISPTISLIKFTNI